VYYGSILRIYFPCRFFRFLPPGWRTASLLAAPTKPRGNRVGQDSIGDAHQSGSEFNRR
jgi:hypothetical protein